MGCKPSKPISEKRQEEEKAKERRRKVIEERRREPLGMIRQDVNERLKTMKVDTDICMDCDQCSHPMLNKWDDIYHCMDCGYKLNDSEGSFVNNAERIKTEQELEKNTPVDEMSSSWFNEASRSGSQSALRGVQLGFLFALTIELDCWEWNSWELIRRFVKPNTENGRMRFVELEWMKPYVGRADTYLSYAQAGKWGDVMAALLDGGADLDRLIWIDIFAVRQWPSKSPDLDFGLTIESCSSFVIVISHQKEIENMEPVDVKLRRYSKIPIDVRKQTPFLRLWCLCEAVKAASMNNIAYIVKCGSHQVMKGGESVEFYPDMEILDNLSHLVDLEKAEATVASDRDQILNDIKSYIDIHGANTLIKESLLGAYSGAQLKGDTAVVQCAACGDKEALDIVMANPKSILMVAANGFTGLLRKMLESDENLFSVRESNKHGRTPLHYAAMGGHIESLKLLLEKDGVNINVKGRYGWTPLHCSALGGHKLCVKLLLEKEGVDANSKNDYDGSTPLHNAAFCGHDSCVKLLVESGVDLNVKNDYDGSTPLHNAAEGGHEGCLKILLESDGIDLNVMKNDGYTPLHVAAESGHDGCLKLLVEKNGINVNLQAGRYGNTPLELASRHEHTKCMKLLKDNGGVKFAALLKSNNNSHSPIKITV